MLRFMLLSLVLLVTLSLAMSQTFQYSRGWTNGKRSALGIIHSHHGDDEGNNSASQNILPDVFDLNDSERKLEKCLLELQHFIRNPLYLRTAAYNAVFNTPALNPAISSNGNTNGNSNNNNLFGTHRHQSNELFEELNARGERTNE